MKLLSVGAFIAFLLFSCKSIPERVKINKAKFIQVAQENSRPPVEIDINNISNLLEQVKENNTEAKMKYLEVDQIETIFGSTADNKTTLDSVVIFRKSSYTVLYDFAEFERGFDLIQQKSGLKNFEEIDDRLYIGKN
jgi:hypothetical protein